MERLVKVWVPVRTAICRQLAEAIEFALALLEQLLELLEGAPRLIPGVHHSKCLAAALKRLGLKPQARPSPAVVKQNRQPTFLVQQHSVSLAGSARGLDKPAGASGCGAVKSTILHVQGQIKGHVQ